MSFGAYQDAKEQVRQATDIVELVSSYLDLRSQGRDFVAHCPWHDDSRPSLRINRERQSWKCWVCDIGGDVFSFVMRREGLAFPEALQLLADRAGIELPSRGGTTPPTGSPKDKRTLLRAAAWAEEQFHQCLLQASEAAPAREYFQSRQITADSIRRFRLGYSPAGWHWILDRARGTEFSREVLEAIGLVARSERTQGYYDRFRNRTIFPIHDPQGKTIAFGGRVLPGETDPSAAKYINSPETMLFSKSEQLYGLDLARDHVSRSRQIMVMEGYTDVIVAVQFGLANAVAVLGTALGERHLRVLRRYVNSVTLVLDGDEAGKRRANDVLKAFLAADLDLRIMTLPNDLDPCDFLHAQGAEAFRGLLQAAPDAIEHKIRVETEGLDLLRDTHRAHQALEEILRTLSLTPVGDLSSSTRLREQQVVARLTRQFGVQEKILLARLEALRSAHKQPRPSPQPAAAPPPAPPMSCRLSDLHKRDLELLEILLLQPELVARAADAVPPDLVLTPAARLLYETCIERWNATECLTYAQLMSDLEDADLKSLLVEIDEQAQEKSKRTERTPESRLTELVSTLDRQAVLREGEELLAELQKDTEDEDDQLDKLKALYQVHRQTKC